MVLSEGTGKLRSLKGIRRKVELSTCHKWGFLRKDFCLRSCSIFTSSQRTNKNNYTLEWLNQALKLIPWMIEVTVFSCNWLPGDTYLDQDNFIQSLSYFHTWCPVLKLLGLPCGPVAKSPCFHCRWWGFYPWSWASEIQYSMQKPKKKRLTYHFTLVMDGNNKKKKLNQKKNLNC